jgi:hypothetical protein
MIGSENSDVSLEFKNNRFVEIRSNDYDDKVVEIELSRDEAQKLVALCWENMFNWQKANAVKSGIFNFSPRSNNSTL